MIVMIIVEICIEVEAEERICSCSAYRYPAGCECARAENICAHTKSIPVLVSEVIEKQSGAVKRTEMIRVLYFNYRQHRMHICIVFLYIWLPIFILYCFLSKISELTFY